MTKPNHVLRLGFVSFNTFPSSKQTREVFARFSAKKHFEVILLILYIIVRCKMSLRYLY